MTQRNFHDPVILSEQDARGHISERYIGCRQVRSPDGNGWFTFVRGAHISRRTALRVLLFGPVRGRIETAQSDDPDYWI